MHRNFVCCLMAIETNLPKNPIYFSADVVWLDDGDTSMSTKTPSRIWFDENPARFIKPFTTHPDLRKPCILSSFCHARINTRYIAVSPRWCYLKRIELDLQIQYVILLI